VLEPLLGGRIAGNGEAHPAQPTEAVLVVVLLRREHPSQGERESAEQYNGGADHGPILTRFAFNIRLGIICASPVDLARPAAPGIL
jgi:hypothetical protein